MLAVCTGCSDTPTTPTPGLTIACPANQTQQAPNGISTQIDYPAPVVSGGVAPVAVACSPPGPATFQVGTTTVNCTAKDSKNQTASCVFQVVVTAPPRLSATSFVAFGDSMSDGVLGISPLGTPGDPGPAVGYAYKLRALLQTRYTSQTIVVTDEGCGGESVSSPTVNCPGGIYRLPTVLARDQPQVLMLLEGVNNINGGGAAAIPTVIDGLRTMVRQGRAAGMPVFLATLIPEASCTGTPCRSGDAARAAIPILDAQIRTLASTEGATLVDLYAAFDGNTGTLIGPDGLHPTDAGYTTMAQTFFDAIRSKLEVPSSTTRLPFPLRLFPQ